MRRGAGGAGNSESSLCAAGALSMIDMYHIRRCQCNEQWNPNCVPITWAVPSLAPSCTSWGQNGPLSPTQASKGAPRDHRGSAWFGCGGEKGIDRKEDPTASLVEIVRVPQGKLDQMCDNGRVGCSHATELVCLEAS